MIAATIQFFDLFSGIGGFREGLRRAGNFVCVGHCEVDTYSKIGWENFIPHPIAHKKACCIR
nr:DNA cytosine methyltransferase [Coprococcus comes]